MHFRILYLFMLLTGFSLSAQDPYTLGIPYGHNASRQIRNVMFDRSGKILLSSSDDGTVCLWEVSTGRLLSRIQCPGEVINAAMFNHRGDKVVTLSHRENKYPFMNTVRIWNSKNGTLSDTFPGTEDDLHLMHISPDDNFLVLGGSGDSMLQLWSLQTRTPVAKSAGHQIMVSKCAFTHDGKYLVSSGWDKKILILNAANLEIVREIKDQTDRINTVETDAGNQYIAYATASGTVKIHEFGTGAEISGTISHKGMAQCLAFDSAGKYFASAGTDGFCFIYQIPKMKLLWKLKVSKIFPVQLKFIDNGNSLLVAELGDTVHRYEISTGKEILKYAGGCSTSPDIFSVAASTQRIAATSYFGRIMVSDLRTGKLLYVIADHAPAVNQLWHDHKSRIFVNQSQPYSTGFFDLGSAEPVAWNNGLFYNGKGLYDGNQKLFYLGTQYSGVRKFTLNGKLTGTGYDTKNGFISAVKMFPVSRRLATTAWDSTVRIFSEKELKPLIMKFSNSIQGIESDYTESEYAVFGDDSVLHFFGARNNLKIADFPSDGRLTNGRYTPDGKYFILITGNDHMQLIDVATRREVSAFHDDETEEYFFVKSMAFSPDGKYLFTGTINGSIFQFGIPDLKIIRIFKNHLVNINCLALDSSGILFSAGDEPYASCWNYNTGVLRGELIGHTAGITQTQFIRDSFVITASLDGTMRIWNVNSMQEKLAIIAVDSFYIFLRPDGYFKASGEAVKKLFYTNGEKTIGFDQLDLRNNRPDLVMQTIGEIFGKTDTAAVKGYRAAYEKRLKKLGLNPAKFGNLDFDPPVCKVENANEIPLNTSQEFLRIKISALMANSNLKILNCWINDVPYFGSAGYYLGTNRKKLDTFLQIPLSEGANKIEVSVMDETGLESFREPVYTAFKNLNPVREKVYFIGIGVNRYRDSIHNLEQSVKDIRDIAGMLGKRYKDHLVIDTLFDENVTLENIGKLKQKLLQTGVNDKVIVSYSGHGLLDNELNYYLGTWNISFEKPAMGGLPYDSLEWLLDGIPARKKLLLLDACHSGELDKDEVEIIAKSDSLNKPDDTLHLIAQRGGLNIQTKKNKAGLQNSYLLMQEVFLQVGKGTGAHVISAAAGTQFALESNQLNNGIFTYCLIQELSESPAISVQKLRKRVTVKVVELSRGLQKPTSRAENLGSDWEI